MNDPSLRYVHFDFHHECKNMQWHKISILIEAIKQDLDQQEYCVVNQNQQFVKKQNSTVRTNCIDCLDRTNVVQSILAKVKLEEQYLELGILSTNENLPSMGEFYDLFRNVWADHADAISMQYSGTGALKTDFTRTGKRSRQGVLNDLSNSFIRYVKNHYLDGIRQVYLYLF